MLIAFVSGPGHAQAQPTGTLTVDDALVTALANNPQVAQAAKQAEAARAAVGIAAATYWPSLNLTLNQNRSVSGSSGGGGNSVSSVISGTVSRTLYQSQLSLSQTLYDFNRRSLQVSAAEQQLIAALQNLEQVRQDVVLAVRQQFYTTYTAEQVLGIRIRTVQAQELHLKQAQGFYEAGLRARNEVTKAEADLAQANLARVQAENDLQVAWVSLNVAMGLARDQVYHLEVQPVGVHPPRLDTAMMMEAAWILRPELQELKARTVAAFKQMEFFYRDRLPTLNGNATFGYAGQQFPLTDSWSLGFTVNWNLFDGFNDRYQARQARANAEALVQQTEQQRQQVYKEVQSAWLTYTLGYDKVAAARVSVASAQANFNLARQRYEVGLGSNLEYTDAQVTLIQAAVELVVAETSLRTARASLERAIGIYNLDGLVAASRHGDEGTVPEGKAQEPKPPATSPK